MFLNTLPVALEYYTPLQDAPLLWILGIIFAILAWILITMYTTKGFMSAVTVEVKSLNNTMTEYLNERRLHDDKVTERIDKLDNKIDTVGANLLTLKSQHDLVFATANGIKAHQYPPEG